MTECCYAECRYAECCYAECRYAQCRYAECRGALLVANALDNYSKLEIAQTSLLRWDLKKFVRFNLTKYTLTLVPQHI
jgi:hypothetical protein